MNAVCSSLPASLPAKPVIACTATDLGCWKRAALDLDDALNTTRDLLTLERLKTAELGQQVTALTAAYEHAQAAAERFGEQLLRSQQRPWHESPMLGAALGGLSVAALAIGLSYGLRGVSR